MFFILINYEILLVFLDRTTTKIKEQRSANTLYQELSFHDNEESDENEVTGKFILGNHIYGAYIFASLKHNFVIKKIIICNILFIKSDSYNQF